MQWVPANSAKHMVLMGLQMLCSFGLVHLCTC